MGFFSLEDASWETRGDAGEMGVFAFAGAGGWCVVCVDVLWNREDWRDAHAVLGARELGTGCGMLRGIVRASERVHKVAEAISSLPFSLSIYCTTRK
jgi:hypothetical protein